MKIALFSLGILLFSFVASASTSNCVVSTPEGQKTVHLTQYMPTGGSVQIDKDSPQKVLRRTTLNFTAKQVDQCTFGADSDENFEACLKSTFGPLDKYEQGLPLSLAYIRYHAKRGRQIVAFDTSAVASGKVHYLSEFNPAFGTSGFIQFFDKNQKLVGQIYEPGFGMLLDCK